MLKKLFYIFLFFWLFNKFDSIYNPKHPLVLNVYFGVPGSGKTTFAAALAKQSMYECLPVRFAKRFPRLKFSRRILGSSHWKRYIPVYSNVPISNTYQIEKSAIGKVQLENCKLLIDEASIDFNNRNFKSMPQDAIKWFKLHRHYRVSVDVFSQSYEDMDITLRRLAQNFFIVKKSIIPYCICARRIKRRIDVDKETRQIMDMYDKGLPLLDEKIIWAPSCWKMFDSYDAPELPKFDFRRWNEHQIIMDRLKLQARDRLRFWRRYYHDHVAERVFFECSASIGEVPSISSEQLRRNYASLTFLFLMRQRSVKKRKVRQLRRADQPKEDYFEEVFKPNRM